MKPTMIRLSDEDRAALDEAVRVLAISRTAVIRLLVRQTLHTLLKRPRNAPKAAGTPAEREAHAVLVETLVCVIERGGTT